MVRRVDVLSLSDKVEQGTLGARMTLLREQMGWSVAELALAANVDRSFVKKLENGDSNASLSIVYKLCLAFGIMPSDFFNEEYRELYKEIEYEKKIEEIVTQDLCNSLDKKRVMNYMKRYRIKNGLSQDAFAKKIDIPKSIINNLEYGRGKISEKLLVSFITYCEIPLTEFLKSIGASKFASDIEERIS